MARSILENPNFSWQTWNPATWETPVEDTPTEEVTDTTPGVTGIHPNLPMGGGAGGDGTTPIMQRNVTGTQIDPFAFEDAKALAARGAIGDDENWFQKQMAFFRNKYPDWATPVGIVNALTGRRDATQSFAGGQGGVGSMAGLYQSEADLLNELMQAGFLKQTPGGVKGLYSDKNVVSLFGGYEEGQEETYQNFINRYGPDALSKLTDKYGEKSNIVGRFKEAEHITKSRDAAKQKAIDKMKLTYPKDVHRDTPPPTTEKISVQVPQHIMGPDAGNRGADQPAGGRPGTTGRARDWAKGGLIRKKYGDGGIVGVL